MNATGQRGAQPRVWSLGSAAALLWIILSAGPLSAQSIRLRAGEHEGFTRFTLNLPSGANWALEQGPGQVTLVLDRPGFRANISSTFSRIPRTRVRDVVQPPGGGRLEFLLGCDCQVETFMTSGRLLVLDFKGRPGSRPKKQTGVPSLAASFGATPYRFRIEPISDGLQVGMGEVDSLPEVASPRPTETASGSQKPLPPQVLSSRVAGGPDEEPLPPPGRLAAIGEMEARLLQQIRRASGQGLLLPQPGPLLPDLTQSVASGEEEAEPPPDASEVKTYPAPAGDENLVVETAIDRDLAQVADMLGAGLPADRCLPDESLALHLWASDAPFAEQIAGRRSALIGEFDMADTAAVLGLARNYIAFGFGAEAMQTLEMIGTDSPDTAVLRTMAQLLDGGAVALPNAFAGMAGCDTDAALWALLSEPDPREPVNDAAVLRAINRLPSHIRELLAPDLARRYVQARRRDMAEAILRAVDRINDEPTPAMTMAAASVARVEGDTKASDRHLGQVIETASELSPEALVALVRSRYRSHATLKPETAGLVSAYLTELRNSAMGPDLRQANILALALTGDFAEAAEQVAALSEMDDRAAQDSARNAVLDLLTERGDDVSFMRYGLALSEREDLPDDLGDRMARRLLDLGFPRPALRLVTGSRSDPASETRRLLRAEAALAEQLPHEALIALLGIESDRGVQLKAEAMRQLRDVWSGGALLPATIPDQAATAWAAEEWQSVPGLAGPDITKLVPRAIGRTERSAEVSLLPPLARARALLSDSGSTRTDIARLLEAIEIPGAGPDG
ncbi:hypothetical protein [Albibacillus kandeliae]|uniref:hypothetical protein n=1 Tax=Albibacillus kandeliae TaxID=2174228 RepID=UPI000D686609|nr:hypothetical protein [Albibacillus kandeliae]